MGTNESNCKGIDQMKLSGVIFEDFVNYKKPSMTLMFPYCTMKCNTETGQSVCQNQELLGCRTIDIDIQGLLKRYYDNPITEAIVMQGMEPFDSWNDVRQFITMFRNQSNDDLVIYTGYNKEEILDKLDIIKSYQNIIIKYGRYIPGQKKHFDSELGVYLASDNQYAERI